MFCNQCEQVAKGAACRTIGVCGKQPDAAALQDLLIYALKGLSCYAAAGRKAGIVERNVNVFTVKAIFSTLTNVSFDAETISNLIYRCVELREQLKEKVKAAGVDKKKQSLHCSSLQRPFQRL